MRKNSVRKWLHAILDLLPLFVIPIFAIYTRNENYNSNIEVQVEQNLKVDFNQYSNDNQFFDQTTLGLTFTKVDNDIVINGTATATGNKLLDYHDFNLNDKILVKSNNNNVTITNNNKWNTTKGSYIFQSTRQGGIQFTIYYVSGEIYNNVVITPQIFNLTQMFGVGNEPTIAEFDVLFPNSYYPYTESEEVVIENYETITYNDTDVGSQFVYTLYNATDKYFNCTNLFNLEQVWNWVQLNLFGGNAPLMVYVVWQVIVYEFFMDLIFLLYSVFMFIIDFAQNCLEKPFNRIRRL